MARKTVKKTKKAVKKEDEELVQCISCGKFKLRREFYISYNEMHLNGVLP